MAIAFGLNEEEIGLSGNQPDPIPVLLEKGLIKEEK
jgi:hypothetical protein